jgi:hypothetical protein
MNRIGAIFVVLGVSACTSSKTTTTTTCTAYFSGDVSDTVDAPQCATYGFDPDAGGWTLTIAVQSSVVGDLQIAIDLGAMPITGVVSSDTISSWNAITTVGADACAFGAGSTAVPSGSFTLAIQSVTTDDAAADAGAVAHGTLDLVTYVHAPPAFNCGPENVENVEVRF